jgi:hypothetical protein
MMCVRVFVCWEVWYGMVWYGTSGAWYAEMEKKKWDRNWNRNQQLTLFDEEDELFGH